MALISSGGDDDDEPDVIGKYPLSEQTAAEHTPQP